MNDTATRVMALADDYKAQTYPFHLAASQVLKAELIRLFTPLTDEALLMVWKSTPVLDSLEVRLSWADYRILYEHFAAMHGVERRHEAT